MGTKIQTKNKASELSLGGPKAGWPKNRLSVSVGTPPQKHGTPGTVHHPSLFLERQIIAEAVKAALFIFFLVIDFIIILLL